MQEFFDKVIGSNSSRICLIAAPGSGKTSRAMLPKATQILATDGVDSKSVLMLTFSRLSAEDLRRRVRGMHATPRASTVHSYCLSFLLSEDNHDIRKRIESILLDFERETLLCDLKITLPKIDKDVLGDQLDRFAAGWALNPHDAVFEKNEEERAFKGAVLRWLDEHGAAMMEEIVYHAVDLAAKVPDARALQEPMYIFVDEYQDLNVLEQRFVELLASRSKLLFIVGDPDQSIYSFKFAHPDGIREFSTRTDVETHSNLVTGRCPKSVVAFARHLLRQSAPTRKDLLEALPTAENGEVHFVRKQTQDDEFGYTLERIVARLKSGAKPDEIIVLTPKRKLAQEFADFAETNRTAAGMTDEMGRIAFVLKPTFTDQERERILLLALIAKPSSVLHSRCYLGLSDKTAYAAEMQELKNYYGSLSAAFAGAKPEDMPKQKRRLRALCAKAEQLRLFLKDHATAAPAADLVNQLLPETDQQLSQLRSMLGNLIEDGDSVSSLYSKFIDYVRALPQDPKTLRVMTLMASKGLEADHVFILGCNGGNLPGQNRQAHLSDLQHKEEQRRLLYVGFTRAKKSLTVLWSRFIPYGQSKGHATASVATRKINGKTYSQMNISDFLQDLPDVTWET